MGFLNAVFTEAEFEVRVNEIATSIARTVSPMAARATKRQLYAELKATDVGESVETSKRLIGALMQGEDFREGVAAMQARRPPRFAVLSQNVATVTASPT